MSGIMGSAKTRKQKQRRAHAIPHCLSTVFPLNYHLVMRRAALSVFEALLVLMPLAQKSYDKIILSTNASEAAVKPWPMPNSRLTGSAL